MSEISQDLDSLRDSQRLDREHCTHGINITLPKLINHSRNAPPVSFAPLFSLALLIMTEGRGYPALTDGSVVTETGRRRADDCICDG